MRMVALTEFAEERQPEHVFFCRPFFCDFCCVVCAGQRLLLRSGRDNSTFVFCCCIAIQKLLLASVG